MKLLMILLCRGGSSGRAAALPKKCKAKDSAKLALCLDLVTKFHNTIISVLLTPFWLNVSQESKKTNVSHFSNDAVYAMTFSAHFPMNLAISGLSSAQPQRKETKQLATRNMVVYPPIAKRFCYIDDEFLKKKMRKYDLDCFLLPEFLGY